MYISITKSTKNNSSYGTWISYSCSRAKVTVSNYLLTIQRTDSYSADVSWINEASIPWIAYPLANSSDLPIAIVNSKKYSGYTVFSRQGTGTGILGTWISTGCSWYGSSPKKYTKFVLILNETSLTSQYWFDDPGAFTATPTTEIDAYTYTNGIMTINSTKGTSQETVTISGNILVIGNGATKVN